MMAATDRVNRCRGWLASRVVQWPEIAWIWTSWMLVSAPWVSKASASSLFFASADAELAERGGMSESRKGLPTATGSGRGCGRHGLS